MIPNEQGTFSWINGKGLKAWDGDGKLGGRLVIDEIDKAGSDVYATLLTITDSTESASWTNELTGVRYEPRPGFSVVMTTNIEQMEDLPEALKDRFPVAIRINQPHPDALARLSID
ncbi:MAG: AAA family ATPase, partial [bacterium]